MLAGYIFLAGFIVYLYPLMLKKNRPIISGIKVGIFVGVFWIFPYTLTLAGAHETSVAYVFKNTLWHMVEQGIGGIPLITSRNIPIIFMFGLLLPSKLYATRINNPTTIAFFLSDFILFLPLSANTTAIFDFIQPGCNPWQSANPITLSPRIFEY